MSELRQNSITGQSVVIATGRAERPIEFQRSHQRRPGNQCPFCRGSEKETPPPVAQYGGSEDGDDWQVRVVPNKYPFLSPADGTAHEVIIESGEHCISLTELSLENAQLVFKAYADRLGIFAAKPKSTYVLVFKNSGAAAGASIEHLHSQLIVTQSIPPAIQTKLDRARQFFARQSACLFCSVLRDEESTGERIIVRGNSFVAFCPFASRFAYEVWIAPREHASRFEQTSPDRLDELSRFMQQVIGGLENLLDHPSYNYLIHTAPFDISNDNHYHWHIEIFPRLAEIAGFELATNCFINPTSPEAAAVTLRQALSERPK